MWTVREASDNDASRLAMIGSATFLETFAGILDGNAIIEHCESTNNAAAYKQYLESGAKAWLAEIEPGSAPVGFALLTTPQLPGAASDGSDLELKRIYILSRFHGQGIAQALMQRAIEVCRDNKVRRLLLGVYSGNERARAFYFKQGFVEIGSRQFVVGSKSYSDTVLALTIS